MEYLNSPIQKGYEEGAHISKHRCLGFCRAVHSGGKESATLQRQSTNANTEPWGEHALQLPIGNAVRQESEESLQSIELTACDFSSSQGVRESNGKLLTLH